MLSFLIYILVEFFDTIFASYIAYLKMPAEGYEIFKTNEYGYIFTLANLLGLVVLWLNFYMKFSITYRIYFVMLIILSIMLVFINSGVYAIFIMFTFVVFHTIFTFYYEIMALKFEKFETVIGLSYAGGFVALGLLLLLSKFNLVWLAFTYSLSLIALMKLIRIDKDIEIKPVILRDIFEPKFLAEVLVMYLLGEYVEVLTAMGYYILRDTWHSNVEIERAIGIALISAFITALLSGYMLEFLSLKLYGILTTLTLLFLPILLFVGIAIEVVAIFVGMSIAFYWVYFRTYLYYRYPKEEYVYRFLLFYLSSNIGGVLLYALLFEAFRDHRISLFILSLLLIPVIFIQFKQKGQKLT